MALGIATCSVLVILGLLPVGLQTLQDSAVQYGITTIARQVSAELQEMPFEASANSSSTGYALSTLSNREEYYTRDGARTLATDGSRYFYVVFSNEAPVIPGATDTYPSNVRTIRATVAYPALAPAQARQTSVLAFLAAKQNSL
jgi:uncharacterized protein (TIGR02598 family)